jgi:hypothetical protein
MLLVIIALFLVIMGYVIVSTFDEFGDLKAFYCLVVSLIAIIGGSLLWVYKANEISCEKKATAQGLEYRYGWWEGCLVKERDGNYIDYDRYRVVK